MPRAYKPKRKEKDFFFSFRFVGCGACGLNLGVFSTAFTGGLR
jgi:hypothetical protein